MSNIFGRDKEVCITELEQIINKPYTSKHKESYINESAFVYLLELKCSKWLDNDSRKRQIFDNLF